MTRELQVDVSTSLPGAHARFRRRIRVLWLIKGLGRGGSEILLCHAAERRDREAFDIELGYLMSSRSWLAPEIEGMGVPVTLFDSEKPFELGWALRLRRYLIERPVDVVHVHSPYVAGIARLVVRTLPKGIRPRTMSTEHLPWSGNKRSTRILNALTFRFDRAHVAVSEDARDSIPRFLRRNVQVLVHGIPLESVRANAAARDSVRDELGVRPHEVLVGTVANLTAQKAYPDLIEAVRVINGRGRDAVFVAAGRGPLEQEMHERVRKGGLQDRLRFLGPVENGPRLIAACDLFALLSRYEGLPLVIMEALALGVPVVATRVGGVPQLVRDGVDGVLVPPARPDLFADALDELILDTERRSRLGRAAAEGATRFDNRVAVKTIESLYRRLADDRGSDSRNGWKEGVKS